MMKAVRKFTALDFAIFKICLCAIGVLLGAYFSAFFLKHICIVWIIAVVCYVILMIRLIRIGCNCKKNK